MTSFESLLKSRQQKHAINLDRTIYTARRKKTTKDGIAISGERNLNNFDLLTRVITCQLVTSYVSNTELQK